MRKCDLVEENRNWIVVIDVVLRIFQISNRKSIHIDEWSHWWCVPPIPDNFFADRSSLLPLDLIYRRQETSKTLCRHICFFCAPMLRGESERTERNDPICWRLQREMNQLHIYVCLWTLVTRSTYGRTTLLLSIALAEKLSYDVHYLHLSEFPNFLFRWFTSHSLQASHPVFSSRWRCKKGTRGH